jgi:HlyD family secretion protein
MNIRRTHVYAVSVLALGLSSCQGLPLNGNGNPSELRASGTIAAREVEVGAEIGGAVAQIAVDEGQSVQQGDLLLRLDDTLLQAQRAQAAAAVDVARAALNTAQAGLAAAQAQYDLTVQRVRLQDAQSRLAGWQTPAPGEFSLPVWYFQQEEDIAAARVEVDAAQRAQEAELSSLQTLVQGTALGEFIAAETRLANAQAAFRIAEAVLTQATAAQDSRELRDRAEEQLDAARTELDAAQAAYDRLLTTAAAEDVREARARVAVAQARYDAALDRLNLMLTGDQSLQLRAAEAGVNQAEAAVAQAEAVLTQAQAALQVVDAQLAKTVVHAPASGVVLARNLEPGEVVAPGSTVVVIGQLEEVQLTVYLPEDQYGAVQLGDEVSIAVDSFPGEAFSGTVVHIADRAEFTPRNVQTVEGRRATVYAVELVVPNPDLKLKPGMPADAVFTPD